MLKDNIKYVLCEKVHVCQNRKVVIGYVIDEDFDKWVVHPMNNDVLHVPRVKYTFKGTKHAISFNRYVYPGELRNKWNIIMFCSVRMKISKNAVTNWQYLLSHAALFGVASDRQHLEPSRQHRRVSAENPH